MAFFLQSLDQCVVIHHTKCGLLWVQCGEGWYGLDCSLPSASSWPNWLPAKSPSVKGAEGHSVHVEVQKLRPLIYVYDLPPEFNAHMLQVYTP